MLVKEFILVSNYDYINILLDGELVESYDRELGSCLEYAKATIVSINPIKGCRSYMGIELEIEP